MARAVGLTHPGVFVYLHSTSELGGQLCTN